MPVFRAEWHGLEESLRFLERLGTQAEKIVGIGVGRAALTTQAAMRNHLQSMVYDQPPAASGYVRTYTLMRSTHASHPSNDHGGDESRARAGTDLAATFPTGLVEASGGVLVSEVGSWISYSEKVHSGQDQPSPRPFAEATIVEAEMALEREVMTAIVLEFAAAPRV